MATKLPMAIVAWQLVEELFCGFPNQPQIWFLTRIEKFTSYARILNKMVYH